MSVLIQEEWIQLFSRDIFIYNLQNNEWLDVLHTMRYIAVNFIKIRVSQSSVFEQFLGALHTDKSNLCSVATANTKLNLHLTMLSLLLLNILHFP